MSYFENISGARRNVVWTQIGKSFSSPVTTAEAINEAKANFEVGLQPVVALSPTVLDMMARGESISPEILNALTIQDRMATMRLDCDSTLGVVSKGYGVVQNQHAFDFIDKLTTGELGGETPTIECAGVLNGGKRIFVTAKFPEPIRLAGKDDIIDMYAVFTTSHDGTGAVMCMITPVRVWCNNTLILAQKQNFGKIAFKHTRFVAQRLDLDNKDNAIRAYKTLNIYNTYKAFLEEKLDSLAKKTFTDEQVKEIMAKVLLTEDGFKAYKSGGIYAEEISTRSRNMFENVLNSLESGVGQRGTQAGTGLWMLNGLTTHFQNHTEWKDSEKKFESIMEGGSMDKVENLYQILEAA